MANSPIDPTGIPPVVVPLTGGEWVAVHQNGALRRVQASLLTGLSAGTVPAQSNPPSDPIDALTFAPLALSGTELVVVSQNGQLGTTTVSAITNLTAGAGTPAALNPANPIDQLQPTPIVPVGTELIAVLQNNILRKAAVSAIGGQFTPTQIAGLLLWLKADAGAYKDAGVTLCGNGDTVQQWNDQSGNGNNASQATAGARPTFNTNVQNGLPAVTFVANNSTVMTFGNFLSGSSGEFFAVLATNDNAGHPQQGFCRFGSPSDSGYYFFNGSLYDSFGSNTRYGPFSPSSTSGWHEYNVTATGSGWTARQDQTQIGTNGTNTVAWTTTPLIGENLGGSNFGNQSYGELLIYAPSLSPGNRALVHNYLKARWGTP